MADAAGVAEAEVVAVGEAVKSLSDHPTPLPHAAWKKLVQDVQVTCAARQEHVACVHNFAGCACSVMVVQSSDSTEMHRTTS